MVKVRDMLGGWFPQKSFTEKADARAYERECQCKRQNGFSVPASSIRILTFDHYWEMWAKECRLHVSEGWKKTQTQMYRDYILPHLGNKKLVEIRSREVGWVIGEVAKLRQPGTVIHVYTLLHKMFADAVDHFEFTTKNPVKRKFKPSIPRKERAFLEPEQVWNLLFSVENHFTAPAIWVMALTGLRVGEVLALKWNAIDLKRKQITIKAAWNKRVWAMQAYPKGKKWTRVPMPDPLHNFLLRLAVNKDPDEFICKSADGGFLHYESVRKYLKMACLTENLPAITPHELRHSATELYFSESASVEDVRRLLNHKSLSATSAYVHRTDERLQGIAEKIKAPPRLKVVNG